MEIHKVAADVIREVARRILADETGKITCATEAARLNREGIPSPDDRRAQLYARPMKGGEWTPKTVKHILTSEAALGYLMHGGRPVIGTDGRPTRTADRLWDRPTRHSPFSGVWMVPPARATAATARRRDRVVICHPGAPVTGAAQGLRRFGVRES